MLAAVLLSAAPPSIATIDAMARKRDVKGLTALMAPLSRGIRNPLRVLETNGAYDVGRFGWRALETKSTPLGGSFVVLTTPLTSEDVGEIVFRRQGNRLQYIPETDSLGVFPKHHRFEVSFDLPKKRATLRDRVTFKQSNAKGKGFLFRMSPNYRVGSLRDGRGKPVPFVQTGGVVFVPRPKAKQFDLDVRYSAVVDQRLYAGSVSPAEATLVNDYWYPMIARWPSSFELSVTTPKAWRAVSQGKLKGVSESTAGKRWNYQMDLPVIYFSLSAGPYKEVADQIQGWTYRSWSPTMKEEQLHIQNHLMAPIVEFYAKTLGGWPFPGYGALHSPAYGGGALEAYSYATYGAGLPEEDAHEPAHTLFGGVLNNTYLDSFWNESFANYCMGLFGREVAIGNREERRTAFIRDAVAEESYNAAACAAGGADIGGVASTLGYGKGADVLQMLEHLVGTPTMVRAMRKWIATHPKGVPAGWSGFERIVTAEAPGKPVRRFFDDWIRRPGYVSFTAAPTYADGRLKLNLRQANPFLFPLDVLLEFPDGRREVRSVVVNGDVSLAVSEKPSLVSLDPYRRVLRSVSPDETPTQIAGTLEHMRRFVEVVNADFLWPLQGREDVELPADLNNMFLIGHPDTVPAMRPLVEKAGFRVQDRTLTYDGTTIDLNHGGAVAIIDLEDGKKCAIGLGKCLVAPRFGRARLALFDEYGRFLRGVTEPKTTGNLTFKTP